MQNLFGCIRRQLFIGSICLIFTIPLKAQLPDVGIVKLNIAAVNPDKSGAVPFGNFEFSVSTGSNQSFQWTDNKEYIDCSFATDFTKEGKTFFISGTFRIWHPKQGKFLLRKGADGDDPPNLATFYLSINNSVSLGGQEAGTEGTVIIETFAERTIAGSFDVTLGDSPIPDEIRHLYKLTGTFKLKNWQ